MIPKLTEELRILKLDLPLKAILVLDLLVYEIGRSVSQQYLMETAKCTNGMLRNYIKLLRQRGCTISSQYGESYRLEHLPVLDEPE